MLLWPTLLPWFKRSSECEPETNSEISFLDHLNLNMPNHDFIVHFHCAVLGMTFDPRFVTNVVEGRGTIWVNCGASPFHFLCGEQAQVVPKSIGLSFESLDGLKDRLKQYSASNVDVDKVGNKMIKPFCNYTFGFEEETCCNVNGSHVREFIRIVDVYGNVFYCREKKHKIDGATTQRQPILCKASYRVASESTQAVAKTHIRRATECCGVDYIEYLVPMGTADKIAEFYAFVFNAPVDMLPQTGDDSGSIAVVGIGSINAEGQASQSLLFRETDDVIPPWDGHYINLYVRTKANFKRVFEICKISGIVWVNPRASDKALDWKGVMKWKQFRFKNILDLQTGRVVFVVEHEVMCDDAKF